MLYYMNVYFRAIRSINTTYELRNYQSAILAESLITYCTDVKGNHHYVCFDGLLDSSFFEMPYCILHRYKGDHHYVCVDVP